MKKLLSIGLLLVILSSCSTTTSNEICNLNLTDDGYRLWLRYDLLEDETVREKYSSSIDGFSLDGTSETMQIIGSELERGLSGLLGKNVAAKSSSSLVVATIGSSLLSGIDTEQIGDLGSEGYSLQTVKGKTYVIGKTEIGALYGTFAFLKLLQTNQAIENLNITSIPKLQIRILNHWDNLDRTVERGYAGFSIWDWHKLPDYIDPRYHDYARANASIGINGAVLTNVNSNALILTPDYLMKVKALADVFRPYGIKVYLTARFSAPIEIGGLNTADPLDESVKAWWKDKCNEIYKYIPDFGGFTVKANSEGQPGPQNYNRDHADGANMLAEAVKPHGGIIMWRAFVYSEEEPVDRAKQAYSQFQPLDEKFNDNVMVQVKNGPIDFQPRESYSPLFGGMHKTPLMMEFQITLEYLGQATTLCYMAPYYKETLDMDTYSKGKGSTVAKILEGQVDKISITGIAGVSNIGNDRNWTGHLFNQSNWYCFGRLAWNPEATSQEIAEEWTRMTFTNDESAVKQITTMMMGSRETVVNYMTPLGLHHIMGPGHHYGPGPWVSGMPRADWTSVYYHKADENGIGFDRTPTGSDFTSQYFPEVAKIYNDPKTCPEEFLLWFHHLPWDYKMKSGKTLWEELCLHYYQGVDEVRKMQETWNGLKDKIDQEKWDHVRMLLVVQEKEAVWWRNSCVLYFQTFSKRPIPSGLEKPDQTLEYYQNLSFRYAPGIRPRW